MKSLALISALWLAHSTNAQYQFVRQYSGSSFFSGWEFYGNYDNLTNGACRSIVLEGAAHPRYTYRRCLVAYSGQRNKPELGLREYCRERHHQGRQQLECSL